MQLVFGLSSCAQTEKPASESTLQAYFNQWVQQPNLTSASIGILVKNELGEIVLEHNSNTSLVPASTQKLLTTASALEQLGPKFRFETILAYKGELNEDGVLKGDLIIQAGGDPTLGSDRFGGIEALGKSWLSVLKANGIQSIAGKLLIENTVFPKYLTPRTWIWEDIGNYYGATPAGFSFHDNYYQMVLRSPNETGALCEVVKTTPTMDHLTFDCQVTAAANNSDNAYIFGGEGSELRYIKGTIPKGRSTFSIKGSMDNPELVAQKWLSNYFTQNGVEVVGNEFQATTTTTVFHSHKSPELSQMIQLTNKYSINLYAEHFALWLNENRGEKLTVELGAQSVKESIGKMGIETKGMFLVDGSGMSRFNAVTPNQIVELLGYMRAAKNAEIFINSLSVAGESGTLRSMFSGSTAAGKIKAKSGYMERVRSYAGYIETLKGEKMTFCIIVNNYEGSAAETKYQIKKLLERIVAHTK